MTTPITLTVGGIALTFNKWELASTTACDPSINYSNYSEHPEEGPGKARCALAGPSGSMLPRLELLGYTMASGARASRRSECDM